MARLGRGCPWREGGARRRAPGGGARIGMRAGSGADGRAGRSGGGRRVRGCVQAAIGKGAEPWGKLGRRLAKREETSPGGAGCVASPGRCSALSGRPSGAPPAARKAAGPAGAHAAPGEAAPASPRRAASRREETGRNASRRGAEPNRPVCGAWPRPRRPARVSPREETGGGGLPEWRGAGLRGAAAPTPSGMRACGGGRSGRGASLPSAQRPPLTAARGRAAAFMVFLRRRGTQGARRPLGPTDIRGPLGPGDILGPPGPGAFAGTERIGTRA